MNAAKCSLLFVPLALAANPALAQIERPVSKDSPSVAQNSLCVGLRLELQY